VAETLQRNNPALPLIGLAGLTLTGMLIGANMLTKVDVSLPRVEPRTTSVPSVTPLPEVTRIRKDCVHHTMFDPVANQRYSWDVCPDGTYKEEHFTDQNFSKGSSGRHNLIPLMPTLQPMP
jgi:hypothetical protein